MHPGNIFCLVLFIVITISCNIDNRGHESAPEMIKDNNKTDEDSVVEVNEAVDSVNEKRRRGIISDHIKRSENSKIQAYEIVGTYPKLKDWYVFDSIEVKGLDPVGITYNSDIVYVSDTSKNLVLRIDLANDQVDTFLNDMKVPYLNQRATRIILPIFDKDSVFASRGGTNFFKVPITEKLNNPTCFDGIGLKRSVAVDQGNNRIVSNLGGVPYRGIGKKGNGDNEFNKPSTVHIANEKVYVVDTGNKRVQVYDLQMNFNKSFGQQEKLINPTGIASDGKYIFICDSGLGSILVYSPEGKLLYKLSQFTQAPSGLYFRDRKLFVADKEGATVKILANKKYDNWRRSN